MVVSEPDLRKNWKDGLGDTRGGSVPCTQNAGTLLIGSLLRAYVHLLEIQTTVQWDG